MTKEKIRKMVIALLLPLTVGFCQTAEEAQAKGAEVSSRGAIVYQEDGKKAEIYAADILFLKEKLDTIPDEIFSPSYYACVHQWEYKECEQQWAEEAHVLVFEPVDENCHRSRCVLEEEGYCQGYEPVLEEHYAYYYIPDPDGVHHKKTCFDCGYQVEEVCDFTLEIRDEEIEPDASTRYCECGNRWQTEEVEATEPETDGLEKPGEKREGSVSENSISENTIITEEEVRDTI